MLKPSSPQPVTAGLLHLWYELAFNVNFTETRFRVNEQKFFVARTMKQFLKTFLLKAWTLLFPLSFPDAAYKLVISIITCVTDDATMALLQLTKHIYPAAWLVICWLTSAPLCWSYLMSKL